MKLTQVDLNALVIFHTVVEHGSIQKAKDILARTQPAITLRLNKLEDDLGKKFWDRVYSKAQQQFGTTEIPLNTFNKVWIVPESAQVFEHAKGAFVVSSHLKVMLEEDYVALAQHSAELSANSRKTSDNGHNSHNNENTSDAAKQHSESVSRLTSHRSLPSSVYRLPSPVSPLPALTPPRRRRRFRRFPG